MAGNLYVNGVYLAWVWGLTGSGLMMYCDAPIPQTLSPPLTMVHGFTHGCRGEPE